MRQGFPLSPLLSVLCIEILAVNIRTSPNVTGVYLPDSIEQYKCSGYADHTTIAVTMDESIEEVFSIYDTFEEASGAKLNRDKSKGMCLGAWKSRNDTPFGLSWVKELPLLGATFSVGNYTIPTWEKPVARLESRLYAWSGRSLSLQGKTTIINVLALSQFGTCVTSLQSRRGRQNASQKLFGPFSGRAKKIWLLAPLYVYQSLGEALV